MSSLFGYYLPLEKSVAVYFNKPKFGWNWSSGSGEEVENVKSLQQQQQRQQQGRWTMDKFWSEKLT